MKKKVKYSWVPASRHKDLLFVLCLESLLVEHLHKFQCWLDKTTQRQKYKARN